MKLGTIGSQSVIAIEMRIGETSHFFPLTSLQIGDLQSYLSHLTLFLAPESNKFFILVDNRPWLIARDTQPALLWQLMVTKSRLSPFANTRAMREKKIVEESPHSLNSCKVHPIKFKRLDKWFSLVDAALCQKKALLPVKKLKDSLLLNKDLHRTLYGFIVFEVAWDHVRGINYLNELQTDTSMAVEARLMKRWEFDSIEQASGNISSWNSGTTHERLLLRDYLDSLSNKGDVFYNTQDEISTVDPNSETEQASDEDEIHEHSVCSKMKHMPYTLPPPSRPYKRRKIMRSHAGSEGCEISEGAYSEIGSSPRLSMPTSPSQRLGGESEKITFEATSYEDVLILFRFNDHDLPFRLKEIIMSDLRLLTLLEYGLPSWVIFLQSYPVFCQIYRPWMCPLARALYVLISLITVLIGFYDLYKNVPLLKATALRLFGPFFVWVETWEMISRIKCLGTMLFLHNFEKAVKWLLMITQTTRSLFSVIARPFAGPILELVELILPFWNICLEAVERLSSVVYIMLGSSCTIIIDSLQILLWPFWLIFTTVWSVATLVIYPIIWLLWEILIVPLRLVFALSSFIAMIFSNTYFLLIEVWSSISAMFQFTSASEATKGVYETSILRSLWNDLFSQIFRALRSILYGFVAFFSTCNRHRLSIYNHIQEFLLQVACLTRRSRHFDSRCRLRKQKETPLERSPKSRRPLYEEKLQARRKSE